MQKEAIITVVGFLGAGKTTLLKNLMNTFMTKSWDPFIILNDYENANLDVQQFLKDIDPKWVRALSGSCICCSGLNELREFVNNIPERNKGITLIEANGTSDACSLNGFLGVGLNDRFLPPIQISVVDTKNWQNRIEQEHNVLEANQIQVSSLIVLTHLDQVTEDRKEAVIRDIKRFNGSAKIITINDIDINTLPELSPSQNKAEELEHKKAHWSSCSTDLPNLPDAKCIDDICEFIPKSVLRIKGCTRIAQQEEYTYFERTPDGQFFVRPYHGIPITGPKLLTIGPGSDVTMLQEAISSAKNKSKIRNS